MTSRPLPRRRPLGERREEAAWRGASERGRCKKEVCFHVFTSLHSKRGEREKREEGGKEASTTVGGGRCNIA